MQGVSLSQELLEVIEEQYGLPPIKESGRIAGGRMGENYWLTAGNKKYFLRNYRTYDADRVEDILGAKAFFARKGISVIEPLPAGDKGYFEHSGNKYALFPFVAGREVAKRDLTDDHIRNLGEYLAKLHLAGRDPSYSTKSREHAWERDLFNQRVERIRNHIASGKEHDAFASEALRKLALQEELLDRYPYPFAERYPLHLIHNDYHEANIFFAEDGEVAYIFDWEKAQMSTRAKEIARALEMLAFNYDHDSESFRKAELFLSSYATQYPIDRAELEDGIRKRVQNLLQATWIEEEHYFNENDRIDDLLARDLMRLDYYARHLEDYIRTLGSYVLPKVV